MEFRNMDTYNNEHQFQKEPLASVSGHCEDGQQLSSSAVALIAYDFNRLVVDEVLDMSDIFPPLVSFHGTNIIDEKKELEQVIDFIEGTQFEDESDVVSNKLNRQMRIAQCKRIWDLKLENARTEETHLIDREKQLKTEIAQVKRNKDHMTFKVDRDIPSDKEKMKYAIQVMKAVGEGGEKPFEEALENLAVAEKQLTETLPSFDVRLNKIAPRLDEIKLKIKQSKESQAIIITMIQVIQEKQTNKK